MNIREMNALTRRVEQLKSKRARLRSDATNISPVLSGLPSGGGSTDKLGITVAQLTDIDEEINQLTAERNAHLARLSADILEENCIYMRYVKGYTWRRIAYEVSGRMDTEHSIKKRCQRYSW